MKKANKTLPALIGATAAGILLGVGSEIGFTERFEGMILRGYLDPIGIPTKCAGDTYDVEIGKRYSREYCQQSLEKGLLKHAEPVLKCAPYLKDKPFALAMAIDHNYHFGMFCGTSIDSAFKAGDYATGCKRFNQKADGSPQWIYVKDKVLAKDANGKATQWSYKSLPGLITRANARREMCEMGAPVGKNT